jgi:hypothetical protein
MKIGEDLNRDLMSEDGDGRRGLHMSFWELNRVIDRLVHSLEASTIV